MLLKALPFEHVGRPPSTKSQELPPMLLMLHGIGSDERDMFAYSQDFDPRFHVLSLRGPHALDRGGYGWFETQFAVDGPRIRPESAEVTRQDMVRFVEQAAKHYRTDPQRVYLMGFSQGAVLALVMALTRPDILAGVIALSGRMPGELLGSSSPVTRQLADRESIKGLPVFLAHGTQDDVIGVDEGRRVDQRLRNLEADVFYREYQAGHTVSRQCLTDLDIWLTARLITRV